MVHVEVDIANGDGRSTDFEARAEMSCKSLGHLCLADSKCQNVSEGAYASIQSMRSVRPLASARPWIADTYLYTYVNITYFHGKSSRARSQSGGQVVAKR